jgi:hypothetical protein
LLSIFKYFWNHLMAAMIPIGITCIADALDPSARERWYKMRKKTRKYILAAAMAFPAACCGALGSAEATTLHQSETNLEADPSIERAGYYRGGGYRNYGPRWGGYYGHSYYRPYRYYRRSYSRGYYDDDCY